MASGRYREALEWGKKWMPLDAASPLDAILWLNEVVAHFCLGHTDRALAEAEGWATSNRMILAARATTLARMLASLGRTAQAKKTLGGAQRQWLPASLRAEWHLSEAAIALAERDWDSAKKALAEGDSVAQGPSTQRDFVFMRGHLARAKGDHASAVEHFAQGAALDYKGQGGEALLAWGDSFVELGRQEEARAAWYLCLERDPQSSWAARAIERLAPEAAEPSPGAEPTPVLPIKRPQRAGLLTQPGFIVATVVTIGAAWLGMPAIHAPPTPPDAVTPISVPTSELQLVDGVLYAEARTTREPVPEAIPALWALPLPDDGGVFGLPHAPTRAWALRHLCLLDPALLARLEGLSPGGLLSWRHLAERCAAQSPSFCRWAAALLDGGTLSRAQQLLVPSALEECDANALAPVLDAPWLPFDALAAWVAQHGPTQYTDERLLSALEAQGRDELIGRWGVRAFARAPRDERAVERLVALYEGAEGLRAAVLALLIRGYDTPRARRFAGDRCRGHDAGCGRPPLGDAIALEAMLESSGIDPWELGHVDGGAAVEALATCALYGRRSSKRCLEVLGSLSWGTAASVASRMPEVGVAALFKRFPTVAKLNGALGGCGVDAGAVGLGIHPRQVLQLAGATTYRSLNTLWETASELAEVPVLRTQARTAEDQEHLTAWEGDERIDVDLAVGCKPATEGAEVALANVLLRRLRSPRRFYIPEDDDLAVLLTMERAACVVDAGLARFGPVAPALPADGP